MKKIIFIMNSMARGGAEKVVSILCEDYIRRGWDVKIILLLHNYVEYDLNEKVEIIDLSHDTIYPLLRIPWLIIKLRQILKKETPKVILSFMNCTIVAALARLGLDKIRLVGSERSDPYKTYKNIIYRLMIIMAYMSCNVVVLQTRRALQYYPKPIRKKSVIISNPIQISRKIQQNSKPKIVTAGRLEPQKNHEMLINAFDSVLAKHPDYKLYIYGEGKKRKDLEEKITLLGLENSVFMPGNKRNLHEEISDAEIFVLPSNYEGLSNALLEAMMMGLACVSTNCAGSDEIIENGKDGLLIPIGNQIALTNALNWLIENRKERKKMALNAQMKMEKEFNTDKILLKWRNALQED